MNGRSSWKTGAISAIAILACSEARALTLSMDDIDAIARTVYAEAGRESAVGKIGVFDTIINRVEDGRFGNSVQEVINAPRQFEPVTRVGGWSNLPVLTTDQKAEFVSLFWSRLSNFIPDVTSGALYFQNPVIVANRERKGTVSKGLTHFGGMPVTAEIGNHTFYSDRADGGEETITVAEAPQALAKSAEPRIVDGRYMTVNAGTRE